MIPKCLQLPSGTAVTNPGAGGVQTFRMLETELLTNSGETHLCEGNKNERALLVFQSRCHSDDDRPSVL